MKSILDSPYNTRRYPSPRAGRYVTAYVKEVLMTEYPAKFVKQHREQVAIAGGTLFTERAGGMRAWKAGEDCHVLVDGESLREQPWVDVWQLDTASPEAVLDVLKYTEFFDQDTERFDTFVEIAQPILEKYDGRVTQSCIGGVGIWLHRPVSIKDWKSILAQVLDFNRRYFSIELPVASQQRGSRKSSSVWFGHS